MSFQWPLALLSLLVAPVLFGAYWWNLRRKRKNAVRYSSVALLRSVVPQRTRWRRHAPVALLLSGIGVLSFAVARPHANRQVPYARTSIILALDVSRSMCANDVSPNRLSVAQAAAKSFVEQQPEGSRMGLVVFSGFAQLAVAPTTDHKQLTTAIDGLTTAMGTAIGAAMLKGLDAIAEVNPAVEPVGDVSTSPRSSSGEAVALGDDFVPDIVVLLTDGANTRGIAPLDAVPFAVERKVRVFTIGFGTTSPGQMVCTAAQLGGAALGGGGFGGPGAGAGGGGGGAGGGGGGRFLRADEPTLIEVAKRTGGQYYKAQDAAQLKKVFTDLPKDVKRQSERREITTWFAAFGALLAAAAVAASLKWSPYP